MKARSVFLTVSCVSLVILAGSSALAQLDPQVDGLGIYFDLDATVYCDDPPLGVPFEMYLILTNSSCPEGVAGWECRIEYDAAHLLVIGYVAHNYGGSTWDPPNFALGLDPPLPWAATINLMTITALDLWDECVWLYIVPHPTPSIPGQVVYADAADFTTLVPMYPATGGFDIPVAGVNCDCPPPVRNQMTTWGRMKSMYE